MQFNAAVRHDYIKPGETFSRPTGPFTFDIKIKIANEDDTDVEEVADKITKNAPLQIGAFALGIVGGVLLNQVKGAVDSDEHIREAELDQASKIFSQDWFLGGINNLEVIGGPKKVQFQDGLFKVIPGCWSPLILRDVENHERNSCGPHYRSMLELVLK